LLNLVADVRGILLRERVGFLLELSRIVAIIGGFAKAMHAGEMDEWFKSHAWKACVGS
jgi:hypothetical protein